MIWLVFLLCVFGLIIITVSVVVLISTSPNPIPTPVFHKPGVTYNDDWLFTIHNDNESLQTFRFVVTDAENQVYYELEQDIPSRSYVELTPYINFTLQLQNNSDYIATCWFVPYGEVHVSLPFRTPDNDAFAEVLATNSDVTYLMNYFRANLYDWVHVTDTDYWTFPSKFWYSYMRGNPGFGKMVDGFPQKAFYFVPPDGGVAIENGNAPYGFNFRANRDMDRVTFQIVWLPLEQVESGELNSDLQYNNVDLIHPMLEGETYYFIQKGARYIPYSSMNYHFPVFWSYPDLVPFGGNDNVIVPITIDDISTSYPSTETLPFEGTTGIFGCYQIMMTGQQFWYPYTNT